MLLSPGGEPSCLGHRTASNSLAVQTHGQAEPAWGTLAGRMETHRLAHPGNHMAIRRPGQGSGAGLNLQNDGLRRSHCLLFLVTPIGTIFPTRLWLCASIFFYFPVGIISLHFRVPVTLKLSPSNSLAGVCQNTPGAFEIRPDKFSIPGEMVVPSLCLRTGRAQVKLGGHVRRWDLPAKLPSCHLLS